MGWEGKGVQEQPGKGGQWDGGKRQGEEAGPQRLASNYSSSA